MMTDIPFFAPPLTGTDPGTDRRRSDLKRMRMLATALLIVMTIVYVAASFAMSSWPWISYVRAFAEAGMVGACADWFAVVALFRHPMGLPIPHTAIVPANKTRIAGAMGRFIANNFLTLNVLTRRLAHVDATRWIADWLANPDNAMRISRAIALSIPEVIRVLPREQIIDALGKSLVHGLEAMPAAPVASNLLAIAWAQGQTQNLIERVLTLTETALLQNKALIRQKVEASSSRWIPRWVDGIFADKATTAITTTIAEMRDPDHPWRIELKHGVESLIQRLQSDPVLQADFETHKTNLLRDPMFRSQINALWTEIENRLPKDLSLHTASIQSGIERVLISSGRWLQEDDTLKNRLNRWLRHIVKRAISPRRAEIGQFVTRVVNDWDTKTLVERIELQVGKDLQYIRINGTLVGGIVGLAIYSISKWILPN